MPLASIKPVSLQFLGKSLTLGQGPGRNLAWQLRAFSQRKRGVNLTAHSFRLSVQAPGEKPHPPTFSRHSSQESSSASEQPARPAVSLPPAVQRKLFPTPLSPQPADHGSLSPSRSTCPGAQAALPGPHCLPGSRVSVFVHVCLAAQGQAFGPTVLVPV